jgi:hypothetical protein
MTGDIGYLRDLMGIKRGEAPFKYLFPSPLTEEDQGEGKKTRTLETAETN